MCGMVLCGAQGRYAAAELCLEGGYGLWDGVLIGYKPCLNVGEGIICLYPDAHWIKKVSPGDDSSDEELR